MALSCWFRKKDSGIPAYVALLEKQNRALHNQMISLQIQLRSKQATIEALETRLEKIVPRTDGKVGLS